MPLPGDPVRFTVKMGVLENEVSGVYQFQRGHSCVILDDVGGEWEVQSMWKMKKLSRYPLTAKKIKHGEYFATAHKFRNAFIIGTKRDFAH